MKRKILIGLTIVAIVAVGAFVALRLNVERVVAWQVDRTVVSAIAAQQVSDDSFEIVFCGTGSPQYQPDRGQPCLGIIAGGRLLVFDAGQGAAQGIQATGAPLIRLDTVFLTHLHSDHMSGLGDVLHNSWLYGRQSRVEVVGPPGTEDMLAGLHQYFAADTEERHDRIGEEYSDSSIGLGTARDVIVPGNRLVEVYNRDGIVVSAFRVDHPNWAHAFGYRIDYQGKSIVISGDTRRSDNLVRHAEGVDYLIHEALNTDMMATIADALRRTDAPLDPDRMDIIINTHTPTGELAELAAEAEVGHLVLTHFIPPIPANWIAEEAFAAGMDDIYDGPITLARDGMRLDLAE